MKANRDDIVVVVFNPTTKRYYFVQMYKNEHGIGFRVCFEQSGQTWKLDSFSNRQQAVEKIMFSYAVPLMHRGFRVELA